MIADSYAMRPYNKRSTKRALVLVLLAGAISFPATTYAQNILLGTGAKGTFSHFTGRILCRVINNYTDDLNCQTVPTVEEVDTLTNIQGGSYDLGLVDSRMLHDAVNKSGYFEFLDISYDNLRTLFPLYDIPIALVVRNDAGVNNLEDLKGKRINAGAPRSREKLAFNTILRAKNWTRQDFSLVEELPKSQSQDTYALCQGSVQAIVHVNVHPDAKLNQLFRLCNVKFANMSDSDVGKMIDNNPALSALSIPANTYPSQTEAATTFGSSATLVASNSLDEETAQKIIEALIVNSDQVRRAHPALASFSPKVSQ